MDETITPAADPAPPAEPTIADLAAAVCSLKAQCQSAQDHLAQRQADAAAQRAALEAGIETASQAVAALYAQFQTARATLAAAVESLGDLPR